ncbi:hypothetical protein [Paracoccus methylarcula]|uniref:Uncharacterized protein n=1 Tax=Paracoccus methylarcula TaxID=72022 RepID=A0A422QZZ2_9RHOB|nr:hypothetical protein [Paracoccus methylarcula]RNF35534.1 hypothetical protein A7A09_003690 [Paracoccus methylarcula]
MNANQLINMFLRLVTRRLMNWGVNKGIGAVSKSGRKPSGTRGRGKGAGMNKKRTRQAMRMLRRIGR